MIVTYDCQNMFIIQAIGWRKVCQIFDFAECIWSKKVKYIFPFKQIHGTHFLLNFYGQLCQPEGSQ